MNPSTTANGLSPDGNGGPRPAPPGAGRRGVSLRRGAAWPALSLLLLLAGCGGGRGETAPATPATPAAYPDLARVPARPRLGYTLEQRRGIAAGLVADRANARYRAAELARATGQGDAPPPPSPAEAAAAPEAQSAPPDPPAGDGADQPPGDGPRARAYVESSLNAASDEGDLNDFMKRIDRKAPDPYGPATVTQLVGVAPPPTPPPKAPAAGAAGDPRGLDGFGSFLGGLLGIEERQPGQP